MVGENDTLCVGVWIDGWTGIIGVRDAQVEVLMCLRVMDMRG